MRQVPVLVEVELAHPLYHRQLLQGAGRGGIEHGVW